MNREENKEKYSAPREAQKLHVNRDRDEFCWLNRRAYAREIQFNPCEK